MITTKIVLLGDTHPARLRGYGYSVQIFVDGEYSNICKLCRTLADAAINPGEVGKRLRQERRRQNTREKTSTANAEALTSANGTRSRKLYNRLDI